MKALLTVKVPCWSCSSTGQKRSIPTYPPRRTMDTIPFRRGECSVCKGTKEMDAAVFDARHDFLHIGDQVRWTAEYASKLYRNSRQHRAEFIGQIGEVLGLTDYGSQRGPEVDVRFTTSNRVGECSLRYAYDPGDLEIIREERLP